MTNICLCIGCDRYAFLDELGGAELDARSVYEQLTGGELYDPDLSQLLLSPRVLDVRNALTKINGMEEIGVFTLYFAGHGYFSSGRFLLCCSDTRRGRFSTTALALSEFSDVLDEVTPRQANFILDACSSGGAMQGLGALAHPDRIGSSHGCSFAFLAASGSDQYSGETPSGGIATTALIRYLAGSAKIQSERPFLDLVEVGYAVSRDVEDQEENQTPVTWGLNLYGEGIFATNPHYGGDLQQAGIPPSTGLVQSEAGRAAILQNSELLWDEFRQSSQAPDARRLFASLETMKEALGGEFSTFLPPFCSTLATRSSKSPDSLAPSDILATAATSLLPNLDEQDSRHAAQLILTEKARVDARLTRELAGRFKEDDRFLLSPSSSMAEFHYLPLRLFRFLAWMMLTNETRRALGIPKGKHEALTRDLANGIVRKYRDSLVPVSDEVAPLLLLISRLSEGVLTGETTADVLRSVFNDFLSVGGVPLGVGAAGEPVLHFTLSRAGTNIGVDHQQLAVPNSLLSVLMLEARRNNLQSEFDCQLRGIDGNCVNSFVPTSYSQFSEILIRGGNNHILRLGHDFWTIDEYAALFDERVRPEIAAASTSLQDFGETLCLFASYLLPDRLALCRLEDATVA